jgi:hypothetical protein
MSAIIEGNPQAKPFGFYIVRTIDGITSLRWCRECDEAREVLLTSPGATLIVCERNAA